MFRIGEFSQLSHVPVKTLRYYADIGLLTPMETDRESGYRYYSVEQLPRLNRILALKDLGFSLKEISSMLAEDLKPEQFRAMLRLRKAELAEQVREGETRIARIESRLRQIEEEGKMPGYDIVLKELPPMRAACLRQVIPDFDHLSAMFSQAYSHIMAKQGQPSGPPIVVYHDREFQETNADVELVAPVARDIPEGNGVVMGDIPAIPEAATCLMKGPYSEFGNAYAALMGWIEDKGYQIDGPSQEVYLKGPGDTMDAREFLTEIQIPVRKR